MMTDSQYVKHVSKLIGADVIGNAKDGIVVLDWASGKGRCLVEASSWQEARQKIIAFTGGRA
jgi:nucleoside diphosphate kinase